MQVQQLRGQVTDMYFATRCHHRDPAASVLQLAHIARPRQVFQVLLGLGLEQFGLHGQLLRSAAEEMPGQGRDIFATVRQARDMDADHVQAVKQVFTKLAGLHQGFQVLVRGGDDANIDLDRHVPANPVELAIGQHPQQAGLGVGRHVADFIEEQSAAIGLFKTAAAQVRSAGESAFFMAEQLGLHQVLGDRSHVQRDKR